MQVIRVLVVDDHDLFRTGMASLLAGQPDIEVVAQASGGRMAVRLADELRPDVILMDVQMPDLDGPEATRQILELHPAVRIIALTVVTGEGDVSAVLGAGACGFIAKDTSIDGVLVAIRAAAQGVAWLAPQAAEVVLGQMRRSPSEEPDPDPIDSLSERELHVLKLIAEGLDNAAIARRLGISPQTAKHHVSSVLAKLGQPSRVQAAVYAVRRGLV